MIRRFFDDYDWVSPLWRTWDTTFRTVDTEKYNVIDGEIVPRKSYKDEQIKQIKEKIRVLEEEKAKLEKSG